MGMTADNYLRLRREGHSDAEIARILDVSLRATRKANKPIPYVAEQVQTLMKAGMTNREIGLQFGVSANTARRWRMAILNGPKAAPVAPSVEICVTREIKPIPARTRPTARALAAANPFRL